jgi:hypothetical protein
VGFGPRTGHVVSFDPARKLYAVRYDDGDAEELTEGETRAHRVAVEAGSISSPSPAQATVGMPSSPTRARQGEGHI